jgi:hypothetical protein
MKEPNPVLRNRVFIVPEKLVVHVSGDMGQHAGCLCAFHQSASSYFGPVQQFESFDLTGFCPDWCINAAAEIVSSEPSFRLASVCWCMVAPEPSESSPSSWPSRAVPYVITTVSTEKRTSSEVLAPMRFLTTGLNF